MGTRPLSSWGPQSEEELSGKQRSSVPRFSPIQWPSYMTTRWERPYFKPLGALNPTAIFHLPNPVTENGGMC